MHVVQTPFSSPNAVSTPTLLVTMTSKLDYLKKYGMPGEAEVYARSYAVVIEEG